MNPDQVIEQEFDISDFSAGKLAAYRLAQALADLMAAKPNDSSELDRRYAITITDLERVIAYFDYYGSRGD